MEEKKTEAEKDLSIKKADSTLNHELQPQPQQDLQSQEEQVNDLGKKGEYYKEIDVNALKQIYNFLTMKEVLVFLKLNKEISTTVFDYELFKKYIKVIREFEIKEKPKMTLAEKNNATLTSRLRKAKSPYSKQKANLSKKTSATTKTISVSSESNKHIGKFNLDLVDVKDLLKNNGEKLNKLKAKYSLTPNEIISIFLPIFEKKIETLQSNGAKITLDFGNTMIGSSLKYVYYLCCSFDNITKLDLSKCELGKNSKTFFNIFSKVKSDLQILNISNNVLTEKGIDTLFTTLCDSKLKSLNVSYCHIQADFIFPLNNYLAKTTTLTSLNLSNNLLGENGIDYISEGLIENKSIMTLDLSYNGIESKGGEFLKEILEKNTRLITLNLNGNYLKDSGCEKIVQGILGGIKLTYLFLENNTIGDSGATSISKLKRHPFIRGIRLSNNKITNKGANELFKSFGKESRLVNLELSSNSISGKGLASLSNESPIQCLVLDDNDLKDYGFYPDLLGKKSNLKVLSLKNCKIGGSIDKIFSALKSNKSISRLDLTKNQLERSKEFLRAFEDYVKSSEANINEINLSANELTNTSIMGLLDSLKSNHKIESINIERNRYNSKILSGLIEAIKSSGRLRRISYDEDQFSKVEQKEIEITLKQNVNKK